MGVPVRWLVERRELGLTVLAGKDALDRRITWAHSIELADPVRWLDGGELLLTTGLRLPRAAAERREYVRRLDAAGVVALGFGVGLSFQRVPAAIVDAAEGCGLPLLEVPLPTPFVAVTRAVSQRLAELEYEGVAAAARGQLAMTRAALRGGPAAVVRQLAVITGGGVALFGPGDEPVATHGLRANHTARIAEVPFSADGTASVGPDGSVLAQAVRVGRRVHGRLVLVTENATTTADRLLLGHAVSLIALAREQPRHAREELNRLGTTLCELLLDGPVDNPAPRPPELSVDSGSVESGGPPGGTSGTFVRGGGRRAELSVDSGSVESGGPPGDTSGAFVRGSGRRAELSVDSGNVETGGSLARTNGTFVLGEQGLCVLVVLDMDARRVLAAADGVLAERGLPLLATVRGEQVIVLVPADLDVEVGGHVGRSAACEVSGVPAALRQAVTAARVARSRGVGLVRFESLAGHVLASSPEVRAVLAARLKPLDGTGLTLTLRAFLEHNGHVEATATALGVHRHTLRARVERIRALLGVDLDDAYVRAELLLGFLGDGLS